MPLTRLKGWDTKLLPEFLAARKDMAFAWGSNDCALFASAGILAITGTEIADDFQTGYTTAKQAFALIKQVTGGATVADAAAWCATKHGLPEYEHPLMAQRGDLVVIQNETRLIAGIVHADGRHVVSPGDKGLLYLPISKIVRAWKV